MGTWMKRHRTKYVFNHEVEGMDHVLEAVLGSSQPDPHKRQQIEDISRKGQDSHPSSDVRAVLNLAINWVLQGHTELQVSSGFKLFSSWAQHHVGALENVLTRDLVSNLLTKPSRNQANLPLLLSQALSLLHHHANAKLFQQLLKVVDAKAPTFLQESPDLGCLKNLLQTLSEFRESLPKGDLSGRMVAPVVRVLASSAVPGQPGLVASFIRDVTAVTEVLQGYWGCGQGAGNGNVLQDCLKEVLKVLSAAEGPETSPCLGALAGLFPADLVQAGIRTLVADSRMTDAAVTSTVRRLLDWLEWPTCRTADLWVITVLKELAALAKFPVLVSLTDCRVEQVMEKMRYPAAREASFNILSHMLLSYQHSSLPFHKILPLVPETLSVMRRETGDFAHLWRCRLSSLIHCLVFLHTGFPDLYDPVLDLIKDLPSPSTEEISQRLAESRWPGPGGQSGSGGQTGECASQLLEKSATGKVGLANLGNTCYMNSVLQTLFMCDQFRYQAVLRSPSPEEKLLRELQQVFATLLLSKRPAWKPRQFLEASRPSWFTSGQQQDCSEFLKFLLDQLHEQQLRSLNRQIEEKEISFKNSSAGHGVPSSGKGSKAGKTAPGKKAGSVPSAEGSSEEPALIADCGQDATLVRRTFGFKMQTTLRCLACQQESRRVEDFLDIPLAFPDTGSSAVSSSATPLKTLVGGGSHLPQGGALKRQESAAELASQDGDPGGKVTHLSHLLGHYLRTESLVGDNQYRCERCDTLQDGHRSLCLLDSPQYLILVLLRFAFDTKRQIRSKVFREVTCPRTLAVPVAHSSNSSQNKKTTTTTTSPTEAKRYHRVLQHVQPKLPLGASPSPDNCQLYGLCAVIVHSGASSECGHYYCYARHSQPKDVDGVLDGLDRASGTKASVHKPAELEEDFLEDNWCLFNDERVSRASYTSFSKLTQRYPSDTPYMLVYKKLSLDSPCAPSLPPVNTPLSQDMCDAVNQDNSAYVQEQEEAAKSQTGRSRTVSTSSLTLDSWQDSHPDTHTQQGEGEGQDPSVLTYVF